MKYAISLLVGAVGLIEVVALGYNFDDHSRALQRGKEINDETPLTDEEIRRLKAMIEKGHFKVMKEDSETLAEATEGNQSMLQRALARKKPGLKQRTKRKPPAYQHRGRQRTANRNGPPSTNAGRSKPRGNKPPQDAGRSHHEYYDDYYPMDDYYYGKGKGKGSSSSGEYYDDRYYMDDQYYMDDHYYMDDYYGGKGDNGGGGGLTFVSLYWAGFLDSRGLQSAVPPDPNQPDEFDAGTVYLYDKEPVFAVYEDFLGNSSTGIMVDESVMFATATGKCTRTDPHDELDDNYLGLAYCQFVFDLTGSDGLFFDELTAEGPIRIGERATLSVTGGLGMFRRTVGEVSLTPVEPDPLPLVEFSFELDLPASYFVEVIINMDENLVPPEVFF